MFTPAALLALVLVPVNFCAGFSSSPPSPPSLLDRSALTGVLSITGEDRFSFLHSQSTNSFADLQKRIFPPESATLQETFDAVVRLTSFCTSTGRAIDVCEALILPDRILLVCSENAVERIDRQLNRHIFPLDKVEVRILEGCRLFSFFAPSSIDVARSLRSSAYSHLLQASRPATSQSSGASAIIFDGCGLDPQLRDGFSILLAPPSNVLEAVSREEANSLWSLLVDAGGDVGDWETLRIERGRPLAGKELTEDYNLLQAGLWHTVHFDKGCYLGQETLSKIATTSGLTKLELHGIQFEGKSLPIEGEKLLSSVNPELSVGIITSVNEKTGACLAYIRLDKLRHDPGATGGVTVLAADCGARGFVANISYPTRGVQASACPPLISKKGSNANTLQPVDTSDVSEAERKKAKLEAMQSKIDALKKRKAAASTRGKQ